MNATYLEKHTPILPFIKIIALLFYAVFSLHAQEVTVYRAEAKSIKVSTEEVSGANFDLEEKVVQVHYFVKKDQLGVIHLKSETSFRDELMQALDKKVTVPFSGEENLYLCKDERTKEWVMISMMQMAEPDFFRYAKVTLQGDTMFFATHWRKSSMHREVINRILELKKRGDTEK